MLDAWQDLRKTYRITLAEVGRRIGKSKQYMSELAKGNIRLSYGMAVKIARALGTTPDALFLPIVSNIDGHNDDKYIHAGNGD